jgi:hypothetical protein
MTNKQCLRPGDLVAAALLSSFLAVALAAPLRAEDAACMQTYDACLAQCPVVSSEGGSLEEEAARTGCEGICLMERFSCEAKIKLEEAKPWIEESTKKLKKTLEDILKDLPNLDPGSEKPDRKTYPIPPPPREKDI